VASAERPQIKGKEKSVTSDPFPAIAVLLVLVLIALFGWFVTVFTRRLKADTAAEYNEITPMVRFCYFSPFWPSHWPSHRHLWFDFCPSLLTEPSCGVRLE
jgi:hypothetical protein